MVGHWQCARPSKALVTVQGCRRKFKPKWPPALVQPAPAAIKSVAKYVRHMLGGCNACAPAPMRAGCRLRTESTVRCLQTPLALTPALSRRRGSKTWERQRGRCNKARACIQAAPFATVGKVSYPKPYTMFAGTTQASNSSPVTKPDASAASRRFNPCWCARLAICAALS